MSDDIQNGNYLRFIFLEKRCARLILMTEEVAVISFSQVPEKRAGGRIEFERSTLDAATWQWLRSLPKSNDEAERHSALATVKIRRQGWRPASEAAPVATAHDRRRRLMTAAAITEGAREEALR